MNWFVIILIFQFLGQTLSELKCLQNDKCVCHKNVNEDEVEVNCGSTTVVATNSEIHIECGSNEIHWQQSFDHINVTKLVYRRCSFFNTSLHQTTSTFGVNEFETMNLINMKLTGKLDRVYLLNLNNVKRLDIRNTHLILTNESFEGTSYLKYLFLRNNFIEEIPKNVFKSLVYLEVLDLGGNHLTKIDSNVFDGIPLKSLHLDSNPLTTLSLNIQSLKHLDLANSRLTSLTVEKLNSLKNISLSKNVLVTMSEHPFQNTSLEFIKYNDGNFTLPARFLSSLSKLIKVELNNLNLKTVPENMIWDSSNITELSLFSNHLKKLPSLFFKDSLNLKKLDLSKNEIEKIDYDLLKPLKNLENLDLSNNMIVQISNSDLKYLKNLITLNLECNEIININGNTFNMPKLKQLKIAHNKISKLSSNFMFSFNYLTEIEFIDLSHNNISNIDPNWINLLKLKSINFANNNFTVLKEEDLLYLNIHSMVNLSSNPLKLIDLTNLEIFTKQQSDELLNTINRKIYVSGNKLICDCRNYEFARYVQNQMLSNVRKYLNIEQHLICDNGLKFETMNVQDLICDWDIFDDFNKSECPECFCAYRPYDKSAIMDCSNKNLSSAPKIIISSGNTNYVELNLRNNFISELPDYEHVNIGKLDVGHNNLTTLNITQLPQNLMVLNLEHNNFVKISEPHSNNTLVNLTLLKMSGNSWVCNCEAKNTINFIHKYSSKIVDLVNITCPSSSPLYTLTMEEICHENSEINTIIVIGSICFAIFGIVFGLLFALLNRYKTEIKIWLYSHNITWSISEYSLDKDKKYDAFISFSQKDEDLVANHLVPGLEKGAIHFKLCLHYRDWVVGDWIPAQITRSVDESRRTIIVLSQNFLDSVWGLMEFRTAYVSALNERRSRLIVILYGDVSTEKLDPELRAYLAMNTYIKWGDNWFWEKLRYALPHKPQRNENITNKIIVSDKLNPLQLT